MILRYIHTFLVRNRPAANHAATIASKLSYERLGFARFFVIGAEIGAATAAANDDEGESTADLNDDQARAFHRADVSTCPNEIAAARHMCVCVCVWKKRRASRGMRRKRRGKGEASRVRRRKYRAMQVVRTGPGSRLINPRAVWRK